MLRTVFFNRRLRSQVTKSGQRLSPEAEARPTCEIEIEDWCCGYGVKNSRLRINLKCKVFFTPYLQHQSSISISCIKLDQDTSSIFVFE